MTDFVKLTKEELMEYYEIRKGLFDEFHKYLIERNRCSQLLGDMENSSNPNEDAMRNYKGTIKLCNIMLQRYQKSVEHMMKDDMKGQYPYRKNTGGRKRGFKPNEQRDRDIIDRAVELGWLDNVYGDGKQILNKIAEEYPELKTPESVRNILKK